jgi:hypothetical protein
VRDRRWVGAVKGDEKDEPGGGDESREEEDSRGAARVRRRWSRAHPNVRHGDPIQNLDGCDGLRLESSKP